MKYSIDGGKTYIDIPKELLKVSIPFDFGVEGMPMGELKYTFDEKSVHLELIQDNSVMSCSCDTYEDIVDEHTPE